VVVGIGGAAVLALIAVIVWRHMRKESEAKAQSSNLTYFSDDPAEGYGHEPTEGVVGNKEGGEFRSPVVNSAANF